MRQSIPFGGRNAGQADRPHQDVRLDRLRSQHFGQSTGPFAPQVVQLKQAILGHRIAERDKQVGIVLRPDMWDPSRVAVDRHGGLHRSDDALPLLPTLASPRIAATIGRTRRENTQPPRRRIRSKLLLRVV